MYSITYKNHFLYFRGKPEDEQDVKEIARANPSTIVVLLPKKEIEYEYDSDLLAFYRNQGWNVIHYPIEDLFVPESFRGLKSLIQFMQKELKTGNVLVHCNAGIGRTGLIITCFLVQAKHMTADQAVKYLRDIRKIGLETKSQYWFLHSFEDYLTGKESYL